MKHLGAKVPSRPIVMLHKSAICLACLTNDLRVHKCLQVQKWMIREDEETVLRGPPNESSIQLRPRIPQAGLGPRRHISRR